MCLGNYEVKEMSDSYYIEGNVYMRINKKLRDHDKMCVDAQKLRRDAHKKIDECKLIAKQNNCYDWFEQEMKRRYDINI
jgi:hypothetical protein